MSVSIVFFLALTTVAFGQEVVQDESHPSINAPVKQELVRAQVLTVDKQETRNIPGTEVTSTYQTLTARILEGTKKDTIVTVENDFLELTVHETFYLMHTVDERGDKYAVMEPYRLNSVIFFFGLFLLTVFVFGGIQGFRGLVSLAGGMVLIMFVLLPAVLQGYSPILVTTGVASVIIVIGSYVTHGFNKTTTAAVFGMIVTVVLTGALAWAAVPASHLSGYYSEETVSLNFNTQGRIDFEGLLLGGIIIGLLGVLYDVAIGQAVAVEELYKAGPHLSRKTIYRRALRIGREHIGALVNTLAIAYVGVSLPLLLLFYTSSVGTFASIMNTEVIATEIIRILIGSIGVILAVPITTALSTFFLMRHAPQTVSGDDEK